MTPPINPPNHPPTHQTIHPPIGGGVSTDFKSSNRIKISWFAQVLLNFYWFWWSPPGWGGGGGLNGGFGMMWGWQGWCGDDRDNMGMMGMTWGRRGRHHYHDKHAGGHLQFFMCVCVCACVHVHACACVCTCVGTPLPSHRPPTTHLPPPKSCREPKTPKFNKSWTNRDSSILFEDSLPLNIPELIYIIVDHPGHAPPPELRKPKSEELQ